MYLKKIQKDILILLGICILISVFFYPTILSKKLPIPIDTLVGLYNPWRDLYQKEFPRGVPYKNFLITDPIRQQIPWRKQAIDVWKSGKMPLWNPYEFSGTSLVGNIQAAVFYPINILFFIFSFQTAWTLLIWLEPICSGIFLYIYLRNIGFKKSVSTFGSICWAFCGFSIAWMTWGTITHSGLWLPLILLAIDHIYSKYDTWKKYAVWCLLFIIAFSSSFLAGHSQIWFYSTIVVLLYCLFRYLNTDSQIRSNSRWIILAGLISIGITSMQWIPLLHQVQQSIRFGSTGQFLQEGWFLPWEHLLQFIIPDFFGNPATLNYWGKWNYGEFIGYVGVIPLMFASFTFTNPKSTQIKFWMSVLIISLIFLLPNPISYLVYQLKIPLLATLQPTRLMYIVDFSLVVLACFGFQGWIEEQDFRVKKSSTFLIFIFMITWIVLVFFHLLVKDAQMVKNIEIAKRNAVIPTIFFILGVCVVYLRYIKKNILVLCSLIIILVIIDLFRFGWKFTPFVSAEYFFPETNIIRFLEKQKKPFRVMVTDDKILPPNVSTYYGISTIDGYNPIYQKRYAEFIAASERGTPNLDTSVDFQRILSVHNTNSPLIRYTNVQFVLSLVDIQKPFFQKVFQEGETRVYKILMNQNTGVYAVKNVVTIADAHSILSTMFANSSILQNQAVVEIPIEQHTFTIPEKLSIEDFSESTISLRVENSEKSFIVISNTFDPYWKATIDGKKTRIYRTNYTFQGILVPNGNHIIQLYYTL